MNPNFIETRPNLAEQVAHIWPKHFRAWPTYSKLDPTVVSNQPNILGTASHLVEIFFGRNRREEPKSEPNSVWSKPSQFGPIAVETSPNCVALRSRYRCGLLQAGPKQSVYTSAHIPGPPWRTCSMDRGLVSCEWLHGELQGPGAGSVRVVDATWRPPARRRSPESAST